MIQNVISDKLQWASGFPVHALECTGFHGTSELSNRDCITANGLVCETDFL